MGFWGNVAKTINDKFIGTKTEKAITNVMSKIQAVALDPIKSVKSLVKTGSLKDVEKAQESKSFAKKVVELTENSLIAVAPFTATGKTLAVKAATTATSSVKNIAITAVTAGAAITSPTIRTGLVEAVTPSNLFATGEKVGKFVEDAPKEVKDLGTKGVVLAATGLGAAGLVAAGATLLANDIKDGGLIDSNNELPTDKKQPVVLAAPETATAAPTTPITPATTVISSGTTIKRRKYTKKQAQSVKVSQRVNVIVNQKSLNRGISIKKSYGFTR